MQKWKATAPPRISRPQCLCCGKHFANILCHLNHWDSKCTAWFDNISSLHNPPPQHDSDNYEFTDPMANDSEFTPQHHLPEPLGRRSSPLSQQQSLHCIEFPGAGVTYGCTTTFTDRFNNDQHSGSWVENIYYPFAGKDEWELGSFIYSSGLLMCKIDDFLKLKMVMTDCSSHSIALIMTSRSRMLTSLFYGKGTPWLDGDAPQGPWLEVKGSHS